MINTGKQTLMNLFCLDFSSQYGYIRITNIGSVTMSHTIIKDTIIKNSNNPLVL